MVSSGTARRILELQAELEQGIQNKNRLTVRLHEYQKVLIHAEKRLDLKGLTSFYHSVGSRTVASQAEKYMGWE